MKSAVAPNIFATENVSIGTGDRNARRVPSLQVLIRIIRSYSAEILRLPLLFLPRSIEFSETELPKSGSGKILNRLLRDAAWARQERAVT
jgi:acyl-CoA synthetase (AMP-forming)/AMP-acid ligase II